MSNPQYQEYLNSDEWAWVRQQVIKRDKCCQSCFKKYAVNQNFDVHHTDYRFFGDGGLLEVDTCILYCHPCHRAEHGIPENLDIDEIFDEFYEWDDSYMQEDE